MAGTDALQFGVGRWTLSVGRFLLISSHALWHDFLQVFHIFGRSIMMLHVGAFARDVSRKEGLALEYAVQNFSHPKSEAIGLGETRNFRFAIASAQNRGELTVSVNALVIHLDGNDTLELLENFLEPVRQWMEMAQMYRADFFSLMPCQRDGVVDRTVS